MPSYISVGNYSLPSVIDRTLKLAEWLCQENTMNHADMQDHYVSIYLIDSQIIVAEVS